MNSSYLSYQFDYHGIKNFHIQQHRSYKFSFWELYEESSELTPNTLYLSDYRALQNTSLPKGEYFWCILNCPEDCDLTLADGIYLTGAYSLSRILHLIQQIFRDYDRWLFALQYPGDISLDNLLQISTEILHMPMTIIDNNFESIAQNSWYRYIMEQSGLEHPEMDSVIWTRHFHDCTFRKGVFHFYLENEQKDLLCFNIILSGCFYARFLASIENPAYERIQEGLFTRLAACLEEIFANQKVLTHQSARNQKFYEMIDLLLEGKLFQDDSVLRANHWYPSNQYQIIVFQFFPYFPVTEGEQYLYRQLHLLFPESCIIKKGQNLICIRNLELSQNTEDDFRKKLAVFLREHVARAGISNTFLGTENFGLHLTQAYDALKIGQKTDPDFWYYYFQHYAFKYLLDQCLLQYDPRELAAPELEILQQSDQTNGTDLFHTLCVYLRSDCSATKSAEKLFIHRTSLLKRLNKIEDLTGIRLKDPDTRLYLLLSYKLLERT